MAAYPATTKYVIVNKIASIGSELVSMYAKVNSYCICRLVAGLTFTTVSSGRLLFIATSFSTHINTP